MIFILGGCGLGTVTDSDTFVENTIYDTTLIIAGEGGPSGNMFMKTAHTYQRENGGEIYEVHSGDEFVVAFEDFISRYEKIGHFEYFGHGNHVGLYVNQVPNVNGALYANDVDNNKDYFAASIYDLDDDIFGKYGWIKFNGCNIAAGYPEEDNFAQKVADHFDVDVVAPQGPTEFSSNPVSIDPIPNSNYLDSDFDGDVYMVSTYGEGGFVVVHPREKIEDGFQDVREGHWFKDAVYGLVEKGLELDYESNKFYPYNNVSYAEAVEFCKTVFGENANCYAPDYQDEWGIRNLDALRMLSDAKEVELKYTDPWYDSYIWWANQNNLLTEDFINKKWYTRGEMAQLSWDFLSMDQN